jgi:hypothetical protein
LFREGGEESEKKRKRLTGEEKNSTRDRSGIVEDQQ